jgi:uncharacterized protein YcfL
MKKLITAMLALSLVLLVGCGGEEKEEDKNKVEDKAGETP